MINYFLALSAPALLLILISIFIIISLTLLFITQKYLRILIIDKHVEYGDIFTNSLAMIFGFIIGFIAVSVWESYNDLNNTVSKEANAIHNMYRTIEAYPANTAEKGKEILEDYVQEVIEKEWPLLSRDKFDPIAYKKLTLFYDLIVSFKPSDFAELAAHQEMLNLIANYRELRRDRVHNAKAILDPSIWLALESSAFLFVLISCLFEMRTMRIHIILISLLASGLAVVFFLLLMYNHPFMGPNAIQPEAFTMLLEFYWSKDPNVFDKQVSD
jgi:hypothetical protein